MGGVSAISSKLDCIQLAPSLHKMGGVSAISSKLDCIQLAPSLHKMGGGAPFYPFHFYGS